MIGPPRDLTVVIPFYRNRAGLLRALQALAGDGAGWPVVVVDDSPDGVLSGAGPLTQALTGALTVAVVVRSAGGAGFARACNAGLSRVQTGWALLLNDDAVPLGDCVARLHGARRLCGPVLCGPGGVESAGLQVGWGRCVQQTRVPPEEPDGTAPVDALSGACLHLPADARLDPDFRHGGEDIELCRRLGGARLVPGAWCWHAGGATLSRRSPEAIRYAVAGQRRLIRLERPGWREAVALGLCAAQVAREAPGSATHWRALWEGYTQMHYNHLSMPLRDAAQAEHARVARTVQPLHLSDGRGFDGRRRL